jgi:bifunctional non-homologous end joining protein LigD
VQKHAASRLHYDFRLEAEGALKSWAVPKGPSMNPADKRLAMMVEDHPFDYRSFEGTIPAGNYGAGTVMVWDEGVFTVPPLTDRNTAENAVLAGLASGKLKLVLDGKKLRGGFMLVKTRYGKAENAWLLIKERDQFATESDVLAEDRSVISDRSMDDIAKGKAIWKSSKPKKTRPRSKTLLISDAPLAPMPHHVHPMLATLTVKPFDRPGWYFEVKWDGYRAIAEVEGETVRLYSRNQNSLAGHYPRLVESLRNIGRDVVLDGEVVVLDERGVSRFGGLQNYRKIPSGQLVYYVFDLLYADGRDLRKLPLSRRKELLKAILPSTPTLQFSEHIENDGVHFFEAASAQGLEGIIAKRADSSYQEGTRGSDWLKIKTQREQLAVIGGFTKPQGSRIGLGSLLLGAYEGEKLVYIGHVGTGFSDAELRKLYAMLAALAQDTCPFEKKPKTNAPPIWVTPRLVCEVTYQEWTHDDHLRHPVYHGLVNDAPPMSVRRDTGSPSTKSRPQRGQKVSQPIAKPSVIGGPSSFTTAEGIRVPLTNSKKVFWPKEGYTKGDLVSYYRDVAAFVVPYLKDRPLSLLRHPNGIEGASFFQKDVSQQPPPAWVETVKIESDGKGGRDITYSLCQNEVTLLYLANLACIELNPWASRVGSLDKPDYFYLDLDPEDVAFERVVETAQSVHKLLDKVGAPNFCKTSGKRGLHVYVPLGAQYEYGQVKQVAELIARVVHHQLPHTTSILRMPVHRQKRVYLDHVQNGRGKTLASAYTVRPWPGATVSTPLKWSEVRRGLDPSKFTMKTMRKRVDRVGDLWKGVLGPGIDLKSCLKRLRQQVGR